MLIIINLQIMRTNNGFKEVFKVFQDKEFKLFRKYKGNFYTAIVYSVEQLLERSDEENSAKEEVNTEDTIKTETGDSLEIMKLIGE